LLAGIVSYRRVLDETSTLFDYQLRQMALSLRNQISIAPRVELPPDQGDSDFVIQIWDPFGARVYLSRPGLPLINGGNLGYDDGTLQGARVQPAHRRRRDTDRATVARAPATRRRSGAARRVAVAAAVAADGGGGCV